MQLDAQLLDSDSNHCALNKSAQDHVVAGSKVYERVTMGGRAWSSAGNPQLVESGRGGSI